MKHVTISGVGTYLPQEIITNHVIAERVNTSDLWIRERTGIETRHFAALHEDAASMALIAAKRALARAMLLADEIDLILVATSTASDFFPSIACKIQAALSMKKNVPAFDLSVACTGFTYGLVVAEQFIRNAKAKHILLVGTEVLSRILDWNDRSTCVLFGDGAGAFILSAAEKPGVLATHLAADGALGGILALPNQVVRQDGVLSRIAMQGREVFRFAINALPKLIQHLLKEANCTIKDIDWIVPHQANLRILKSVCDKIGYSLEKVSQTVVQHGNTSAASIPLAWDVAASSGQILNGYRVLLLGFGGGMTWGGVIVDI